MQSNDLSTSATGDGHLPRKSTSMKFALRSAALGAQLMFTYGLLPILPDKDWASMIFVFFHFFAIPVSCALIIANWLYCAMRRRGDVLRIRHFVLVAVATVFLAGLALHPIWPYIVVGITFR